MITVYENSIKPLESELSNLEKQKNNLHDLLERGIYDVDTYMERSNNLSERIKSTTEEIAKTHTLLEQEKEKQLATNSIVPRIEQALSIYNNLKSPEHKNKLLKTILDKAVYTKEKSQKNDDFALILHPHSPQ